MDGNIRRVFRAAAIVFAGAGAAWCGTVSRTDFTPAGAGRMDSNITVDSRGVGLAVKRSATIKLFGDTLPGVPNRSNYPDVVISGTDTVDIFFVDTTTAINRVATQRIRMLPGGSAVAATPVKAFDARYVVPGSYLHVDRGPTGYCASFIQKEGNYPYLSVHNGTLPIYLDTTGSRGWLYSSQCALGGDTFCIVYSLDATTNIINKVFARGPSLQVTGLDTVFTDNGTAGSSLLNCAVAADGNGTILSVALRGGPVIEKYMKYKFYSRDLTPGPQGQYASPVADNSFYYYDDVGAVSYAAGKFAVVSWDPSGVLLHTITLDGSTVSHTTNRIIAKSGIRFCTVAASGKYLVVACMGDVDGNGVRCVEGIRYIIVNGTPDSAQNISFSDPAIPVITYDTSYSSAINSVVDDSGTIAIVWRNQYKVAGCIWAHRPIRYEKAFYQSPVESLLLVNDSLRFNPILTQLSSNASWYTGSYLRYGATPAACAGAPWISFSDPAVLSDNRTESCYFQYKIYLNRVTSGEIDSFTTPYIKSVTVSWNAQPRFVRIDSVDNGSTHRPDVLSGDTLPIVARRDTSRIAAVVFDSDNGDAITVTSTTHATPQDRTFPGGTEQTARFAIHPFIRSDTVYRCSLTLHDNSGWQGVPAIVHYRTVNIPPQLTLHYNHRSGISGGSDSSLLTNDTTFVIQEEDTVAFHYTAADSNDQVTVRGYFFNGASVVDSAYPGSTATVTLAADTLPPADTIHYRFEAVDPDTVAAVAIGLIVNHKPVIKGVVYDSDTLQDGDTANVVIDDAAGFSVVIDDTDCYFQDTIRYRYTSGDRRDSVMLTTTTAAMTFVPDSADTSIDFHVRDRFGRTDSMHIHLAYPWFATDSLRNPGFVNGLRRLAESVALIAGSMATDTVHLPVRNTGRNDLTISAIYFTAGDGEWVQVTVGNDNDTFTVTSASGTLSHEVTVAPDSTLGLHFHFTAKTTTGDTIRHDTLLLTTNDPRHKNVRIPVRLEHNDLPRIIDVNPSFIADTPYRSLARRATYLFPPHAVIALAFSEPMDTAGAAEGITVYSVFDRLHTGIMQPIPLSVSWFQNGTVAHIAPDYNKSSPSFGLRPPRGLFIPTDSIVMMVSSDLHDRAQTPSGPNALDIDRNYIRDSGTDTSIAMRIDSISFTIAEIGPAPGNRDVDRNTAIKLTFSSPVYAASVDTSLVNNRSLSVRSEYNGFEPLPFIAIKADSLTVEFRIRRELFYRDSLACVYHSRRVRDLLGYATDNDRDGIDATIFDSLATDDNLEWGYRVRTVTVASVEPDSLAAITEVSPKITIRFDGRLPGGVFDTDTGGGNVSFRIGSGRTGHSPLRSVRYLPDSTGIVIEPRLVFFSNDSVYCKFTGFTSLFRYSQKDNLPGDTLNCFSSYAWHFHSGEIGFYTFPNPYKPATDPRHCSDNGPCGIWFKNLHTLAKELDEVEIRIYTMNAHPVFDSGKKGKKIRFPDHGMENLPQWKWNTRNGRGELVATGIYLYAIFDTGGNVLKKGKLIIVR